MDEFTYEAYPKCQDSTAVHVGESVEPFTILPSREKAYNKVSSYCACKCREDEKEHSKEHGHERVAGRDAQRVNIGRDTG